MLPLASQQAQILSLITRGGAAAAEEIRDEDLLIQVGEAPGFKAVPVTEELQAVEDRVVEHLAQVIPPETRPRLLLFGPGMSKTDPLYALRFLAKLAIRMDRTGEVTAYDLSDHPWALEYYQGLPWGGHEARLEFGRRGDFTRLRGAQAHLILSIHPGIFHDEVFSSIAENLVRGGIGLMQSSTVLGFEEGERYEIYLESVQKAFVQDNLEFFQPPLRSRLFHSSFAERSSDVQVLVARKK